MVKIATIILNRNLPEITDDLYNHVNFYNGDLTDIYVVEAGSDPDNLSKNCTYYINDKNTLQKGLRYSRGMNCGLLEIYKKGLWNDYEFFFLLSNDTELRKENTLAILTKFMNEHNKVGILSPCSKTWGEKKLFTKEEILYFWYINKNAFLIRREFLESIVNTNNPTYMDFLFDGSNFYGYLAESEIIAKAYANNWAAAITINVFAEENESYLIDKANLIKTENYDESLRLYVDEGKKWLRNKYGFNSRWIMNEYVKSFYDRFFEYNPNLIKFKL